MTPRDLATERRPRILLLLSTTSYRAEDFLAAAEALYVDVVVGSDHRQALASEAPKSAIVLDFGEIAESVHAISDLHAASPFDAIIAADDEGAVVGAAASEALGLPGSPAAAVRTARRKDRMRETLDGQIRSPRHASLSADDDPADAIEAVGLPCVVKPVAWSASRGVIRADTRDEAASAVACVAELLRADSEASRTREGGGRILIEEYIPGDEVAVEALLDGGRLHVLAVLDKPDPLEGPYFEETLFVTPSRLPAAQQAGVTECVARAAEALGLREGPVHAELRLNTDGAWLIEIAPRTIGGLCARLFRYRSGVALEELVLRHALGLEMAPTIERLRGRGASGVMMIPIPQAGRLAAVDGVEASLAVTGIEDVVISIPIDGELVPLPEGRRYLGFIFARGDAPDGVEAALRDAHARLRFTITGTDRRVSRS